MISRWIVEAMQEAERVMEAVVGFGTGSDTLDASLATSRKKLTDTLAQEGIHGMTHEHRWLDRGGVNVCWCGATDPPYAVRVKEHTPASGAPAIKLFELAQGLAQEVVALHDGSAEENVVVSGYTLGGMYDEATELLPLITDARALLNQHIAAAYAKGRRDAEEAIEFVQGFLSDLSQSEVAS